MNLLTKCLIAEGMADLIERDYHKSKHIYNITLRDLHNIFGDVPPEDRAEVYEMILELLRIKDVPFDNKLANF